MVRKVDFATTNSPSPGRTLDLVNDIVFHFHDGNAEETIVNKAAEDLFAKVQPAPYFLRIRGDFPICRFTKSFGPSATQSHIH